MGRVSAEVTNRWHQKNYDIINATLPKGYMAVLREECEKQGKSVNAAMVDAIRAKAGLPELQREVRQEKEDA